MFETQGGTRNRTRDLPKKGSAFILSSDHWTYMAALWRPIEPATVSAAVIKIRSPTTPTKGECAADATKRAWGVAAGFGHSG